MTNSDPARPHLTIALTIAGALAALIPAIAMWGFTVDDALITIRYAHHVASGVGYRFNVHGVATDGVTPLPLPWLLAQISRPDDLLVALERVKVLGVVAWTLAATFLGHTLAKEPAAEAGVGAGESRRRFVIALVGLFVMALAFPLGAWAASGMETGFAMALTTIAASLAACGRGHALLVALLAGVAATLRPELVVWAIFLSGGIAGSARERATRVSLAFAPFVLCVMVRLVIFGRPTPLALMAKPSDLAHGITYGVAATIVVLTPLLALSPVAIARSPNKAIKAIAVAALAHVVVVIAVGGDWMPYARLMVPIAPSLVLVFVETTVAVSDSDSGSDSRSRSPSRLVFGVARAAVLVMLGVALIVTGAGRGRRVHADRKDLIGKARPVLASSKVIASLDIGWTGAAAPSDATVVDLAGVTDQEIAALPGGHTSKSVDLAMLLDRKVDTLVIYSPTRLVELRVMHSPLFASRFERVADLPLGTEGAHYEIYRLLTDSQKATD